MAPSLGLAQAGCLQGLDAVMPGQTRNACELMRPQYILLLCLRWCVDPAREARFARLALRFWAC